MFDTAEINMRYLSRFSPLAPIELAKKLGIKHSTVYQWKSGKRQVPWERLKEVIDSEGLSWDWMLCGEPPIVVTQGILNKIHEPFDWHGINQRFLSLFSGQSQTNIGNTLGLRQTTVHAWYHDQRKVPWRRLQYAVDHHGVSWHWLITGTALP